MEKETGWESRCDFLPMIRQYFTLLFIVYLFPPGVLQSQVRSGADQTEQYFPLLHSVPIAVVANRASVLADKHGGPGINLVDTLFRKGFSVVKIFSPEHGFRGNAEAGALVDDETDSATAIPVISLYGNHVKPTPVDLKNVGLVVFDLQDVGVRFFTYLSTLSYVMESCAENNIPLLLLDRPNPNGFYIDGPVLQTGFKSFIGLHPVPVVYGMTIGEYAQMVNGEGWLKNGVRCSLTVVPLEGYSHSLKVGVLVKPSPNLTTLNAIRLYPSLCFFEGTRVSIGRGTRHPFEVFGDPALLSGSFSFIPVGIPGMSLHPPYEGRRCFGINLQVAPDMEPWPGGNIQLFWLISAYKELGSDPAFFTAYFDLLAGTDQLRKQIMDGKTESEIRISWEPGIEKFVKIRKKYLLYPD